MDLVELIMLRNCKADTLFGKADDKLSRMASLLAHITRNEDFAHEEMRAYGAPSECWPLIQQSLDKLRKQLFDENRMDEWEFIAAVSARTSSKWVYNNLRIR
jgi:hypothetical protein